MKLVWSFLAKQALGKDLCFSCFLKNLFDFHNIYLKFDKSTNSHKNKLFSKMPLKPGIDEQLNGTGPTFPKLFVCHSVRKSQ